MQNTYIEQNGEIDLFGEGNTNNGMTDSDSICRENGIIQTNLYIPEVKINKEVNNKIRYSSEVMGLMLLFSYRATKIVTFMSGN